MTTPTQANRQIQVSTPLGDDVLLLTSFSGSETMSRLFRYHLEFLSDRDSIPAKDIVGKNISFNVRMADDSMRSFNGFVSRFTAAGREVGIRRYHAEVVPWLWFLTRTADSRIFQEMTVPDIIEQIFQDLGFSDYELDLNATYEAWEYCVQYRETDFNFVSRLMEQEGIFYYFRHEEERHILVLADHKGAYCDCPERDVEYEHTFSSRAPVDRVTSWEHEYAYVTGKWAQTDYNFIDQPARSKKSPAGLLMATAETVVDLDKIKDFEVYDYPGEYETGSEGKNYTKIRMEEDETTHDVASGESTCKTFTVGGKFSFAKHDCEEEQNKAFVITSIQHTATEPADYAGEGYRGSFDYTNRFTCIPDSVVFRPERTTAKPAVYGSQTAVVTGPEGEEIWTDEYGRVKVQFYWDREGVRDDNSSCWIRCSQVSAGKNWGAMFIPRIGQEVVVTYLEGDPDRPLITGVVYNADQMPAYTLPDDQTKSYIKTNSSPEGDGYNEVRFEDKKDEEQIFIHAQRNMDVRVLNDSMERVIANRHLIVGYDEDGEKGGDQCELVYQDKHLNVKRNQIEHIEGNMQLMIGNGDADDGGKLDVVVENKKTEKIGADGYELHVEGDCKNKIDGKQSMSVSGDYHEKTESNYALEAQQAVHIKGMSVVIEADTQVSLKVGGNFVDISQAGVSIKGNIVLINSGGSAGSGSGSSPDDPGDPEEAAPTEPDMADDSRTGSKSAPDSLS